MNTSVNKLVIALLVVLIAFVVGFAKEFIWDKWLNKGTFEWMDIVYTVTGGIMAMVLLLA